ncbi:hypothetical protein MLD38_023566 [Melastoma candidum]|uniref:Uncharacterized protein n=1 Tax=Melastoma candidum TaxID=119954 RepID=A0ACB9NPV2_9MYRT|nr:hypothetical protein MLD38_023566 [Melastoma candidum]
MSPEGVFAYSFVARGTLVLAEHSERAGNFPSVAVQCLLRLPSSNEKFSYSIDGHSYHYLLHDGYAYCVVTEESVGRQLPDMFLERVKADFQRKFGRGKADTAMANSLTKEFGPVMKGEMKYVAEHVGEFDKLSKVKAEVTAVQDVMRENIVKAMDRGVALTVLEDKAESLRVEADRYKAQAGQVKRKMWLQNMKVKLIVIGILFIIALVIWLSVCRGFSC